MPNPFTQIPASVRKWIYLAYGIAGLVLGALQVADVETVGGFSTDTALQVLAYVGLALGFTAASNVTETNTAVVEAPANVELDVTEPDGEHRILGKALLGTDQEAGESAVSLLIGALVVVVLVLLVIRLV